MSGFDWMKAPWTCPKCSKTMKLGGKAPHALYCGRDYWQVILKRIVKTDGCWLWTGALQRDGYAHFTLNLKTVSAHRYVYEKLVGPIPDGMDLLHSCDVRHCVNPEHLRPGTHEENIAEMMLKGRCGARGERCIHAKLDEAKVREIRRDFVAKNKRSTNVKELAGRYGVSIGAIHTIIRGESWRHVK